MGYEPGHMEIRHHYQYHCDMAEQYTNRTNSKSYTIYWTFPSFVTYVNLTFISATENLYGDFLVHKNMT